MAVKVFPVSSSKEMRQFIRLPWKIYHGNPCWVPPLLLDQKKMFSRKHCPFLEHSEAEFFLARRDDEILGRIVAIKNNNHLKVYDDGVGFFGFFETVNDQEVAQALLNRAGEWLQARGLKTIRGPENYSQNETAGLLTDAFDRPPVIEMTYNPPYYVELIESAGFKERMKLLAYAIEGANEIPERLVRVVENIRRNADFTVRPVNLKRVDEEVEKIKSVYNSAWSENWGAVPFTENEIKELKNKLISIVIPDLCFIAEINGAAVGTSITVPDFNEVLIKLRNGRLLPFGIFKLLWYRRKISGVRTIIMGVKKEHRHKGIDIVFYYETFKNGLRHGFHHGEMSWILESNMPMRQALDKIYGTRIYKTYCLYEKEL